MKNFAKNFLIIFLIFVFISSLFSFYIAPEKEKEQIGILAVVEKINLGQVDSIKIIDNQLIIGLKDGTEVEAAKEVNEPLSTLLKNFNVDPEKLKEVKISVEEDRSLNFWLAALLPFLLPFLIIAAFIYFMMRQVQGANSKALMFGQSRARESSPQDRRNRVTFKDVAGVREAKEELGFQGKIERLIPAYTFKTKGFKFTSGI